MPGSGAVIVVPGKDADPKAWQRHVERSRTPPGAARASQRGQTLPDTALDSTAACDWGRALARAYGRRTEGAGEGEGEMLPALEMRTWGSIAEPIE